MTAQQRIAFAFSILLLALPWLTPFTPGPSPAGQPWLVSLAAMLSHYSGE